MKLPLELKRTDSIVDADGAPVVLAEVVDIVNSARELKRLLREFREYGERASVVTQEMIEQATEALAASRI